MISISLGVGVWVAVCAFSAAVVWIVSCANGFFRAASAMWRPIVLTLVAAYLLFTNDQGQELGVSLLEEHNGIRFCALFVALIFWAANNWHSARVGLRAAVSSGELPRAKDDDTWQFWSPRLLGVAAHLFAAINLSLAAQKTVIALSIWRPLVWTAPLVIVFATILAWHFDQRVISQRNSRRKRTTWTKISGWLIGIFLFFGFPALLGGVAALPSLPPGLTLGALSITGSAIVFLVGVSWLRRRPLAPEKERDADDKREGLGANAFTCVLFGLTLVFAIVTWFASVAVGRTLGSMVIAYIGFGAVLATLNAAGLVVASIVESNVLRPGTSSRVVAAYAIAFMVVLGLLNAWLRPFHRVRLCEESCEAPTTASTYPHLPDDRPSVAAAAKAWYAQAKPAYGRAHGDGPVPMIVVAAAGGGIRAAYWTAEVLETLASDFNAEQGFKAERGVQPYLFAISGVSGGSVGASAFTAALAQRDEGLCRADEGACSKATTFLTADFLAPALASLIFVDAPSSFLPDLGQSDRGTALERSFEDASGGLLGRPFLSLFPYDKHPTASQKDQWRPILLLNATHEETGKRFITGHVRIDRNVFIDSFDGLHETGRDVRASTAAHNSARFVYVSPAGELEGSLGSMIDGGYFENFGALTALEIARAAQWELRNERPKVKLIVLMISSDPGLKQAHELVRIKEPKDRGQCLVSVTEREGGSGSVVGKSNPDDAPNYLEPDKGQIHNAWLNEFLAPLEGIKNVRDAHGNRAAAELALQICAEYPEPKTAAPEQQLQKPQSAAPAPSPSTQLAGTLARGKDASVEQSQPAEASQQSPYFAHLSMCTEGDPPPIQPPLGWVLSSATRVGFRSLLGQCGNDAELKQLEIAIGQKTSSR